jgi:Arc/MetJ family transcription regulator
MPLLLPRIGKWRIPIRLESDSKNHYDGIMKTTVDIPEGDLADAMRFTRAKTKREAIVAAIQDFNRRRRMAELVKHAGTCDNMMSVEELQKQRRKG